MSRFESKNATPRLVCKAHPSQPRSVTCRTVDEAPRGNRGSRCADNEQPPEPLDPELSLEGENCTCCRKDLKSESHDLNSNRECLKYKQLCQFLGTPITMPVIDEDKLFPLPNPPLPLVPDCQKVIYPSPIPGPNQLNPAGKVVLIVGGAKGLGKATAEYLSQNGYDHVIATSSRPECYEHLPHGTKYKLSQVPLDIRSDESVENFFRKVIAPIGKLNIVINFAGVHWVGPVSGASSKDYENCLQLKVLGFHRVAIHALPYLRKYPDSRVLSLSSIAGGENFISVFQSGYNVSNHAVSMWSDNFMIEERILYATGAIPNPVTFVVIQPQIIKSTIGLYDDYIPSGHSPARVATNDLYTRAAHLFIAGLQTGAGAALGLVADPQIIVAQQLWDILSYPQPRIRYIVGDPGNLVPTGFGPLTWAEIVQYYNSTSQENVVISALENIPALYNDAVLNFLREEMQSTFCGASSGSTSSSSSRSRVHTGKKFDLGPLFCFRHEEDGPRSAQLQ